jgi:hypothetical protein
MAVEALTTLMVVVLMAGKFNSKTNYLGSRFTFPSRPPKVVYQDVYQG